MNRNIFLLFIVCVSCLFSCLGKNNAPKPPGLIVGTWTLQQQAVLVYQDSIKIADTLLAATPTTYGKAQFNSDGTFNSSGVYFSGNTSSLNNPPPSSGNSSGKYNYSNNVFTISPGLAGWYTFVTGSNGAPTNNSQSIKITQLTTSYLTVHSDNKFTLATGTGTHTYEESLDYYYSR